MAEARAVEAVGVLVGAGGAGAMAFEPTTAEELPETLVIPDPKVQVIPDITCCKNSSVCQVVFEWPSEVYQERPTTAGEFAPAPWS